MKARRQTSLLYLLSWGVLLVVLAAAVLLAQLYYPPLLPLLEEPGALEFRTALEIAARADFYADRLPMPPMPRDVASLQRLVLEVAPYFAYEGISDVSIAAEVTPRQFPGEGHFHIAGMYHWTGGISLNARYLNIWCSRWYSEPHLLATLIHELAHAQGVVGFSADVEPAAQIATLEVLASMVRDGNIYALPAFVRQVQAYAEYYAQSQALQQGKLAEYEAYVERTANTEADLARYYRSKDHWAQNPGRLQDILGNYGETPYVLLVEALADPEYMTRELPSVPNEDHRICLNDTAWVLEHLPALARDYDQQLRAYRAATGGGG